MVLPIFRMPHFSLYFSRSVSQYRFYKSDQSLFVSGLLLAQVIDTIGNLYNPGEVYLSVKRTATLQQARFSLPIKQEFQRSGSFH